MSTENYLKDISDIKNMMNKSVRFISLSGLSGIMAGIYALLGGAIAYYLISIDFQNYEVRNDSSDEWNTMIFICFDLIIVAFLAIITGIFLSARKAKRLGEKLWTASSRRLILSLFIPLLVGGCYILILLWQQKHGQTAALMLIFYGLSLVNASKHTVGDIKYLGYIEIAIGLVCAVFPGYGFWFWLLGFGVFHIIYGSLIYFKHDKK
jgi:hypothetical protein